MWLFFYNLLLFLAFPFIWLRLKLRARQTLAYAERTGERFGLVSTQVHTGPIWFHTVSAGEVIAAAGLIRRVALAFPNETVLVTCMTVTGSEQIQRLLSDVVEHVYAPYDFPWVVNRFLRRVKPRVLILMETEMWPNLIHKLVEKEVPVLLMNARLSERSYRGYWRISGLSRPMFSALAWTACQYPLHAERLQALGVPANRLSITGSVKFDVQIPEDLQAHCQGIITAHKLAGRKIWIAASTHADEEALVLDAHKQLLGSHPDLLLLLVPRHPERFTAAESAAKDRGFTAARLSEPGTSSVQSLEVLVCDQMGQLMYLYALADIVYIGGTMTDSGGHNIIEPGVLGKPIIAGPSRYNFTEIYALFESADAVLNVASSQQLVHALLELLESAQRCSRMGSSAVRLIKDNSGASDKVYDCLLPFMREK